jgi:hypothetical protein
MNLHQLTEPPAEELGRALEAFEPQFRYPLGNSGWFRISHGRAYLPFFQAMGPATLWVAEKSGWVLGTLVAVARPLQISGESEPVPAWYVCDLKISPEARRGRVLAALMSAAKAGIERAGGRAAYGIVMGGTGRQPGEYTGRLGIPSFNRIGEILVLRIARGDGSGQKLDVGEIVSAGLNACRVTGGDQSLRSLMVPVALGGEDEEASAVLGDTRVGKRLWLEDGSELLSGHLSGFRFTDPAAGAEVIRQGVAVAEAAGLPAVFVSVPAAGAAPLLEKLSGLTVGISPATIYGCGLPPGMDWWVDTAEI